MKKLIMMVGIPRSGKSTKARELSKEFNAPIVNPDSIHMVLHGTPYREEANPVVWGTAKIMVQALFEAGHNVVILDACNNTKARRKEWKDWSGKIWNREYSVIAWDNEVCLERAGDNVKLYDVIDRMTDQHEPVENDEVDVFEDAV